MTDTMKTASSFTSLLITAFLLVAAPLTAFGEDRFLSAIDDLPLMTQLNEIQGSIMEFDSPSGRIIETIAMGAVSEDAVLLFYSETLPQLGWAETSPNTFVRDGEVLRLEFLATTAISGSSGSGAPMISVQFMLSPAK